MSKPVFMRDLKLTLGTLELTGLSCAFKVTKNLKPEPNTCEIIVRNLSESSRKLLESAKKLTVRLEAGYEGRLFQLFLGEVRAATSKIEGPTIVTTVSTGDSEKQIRGSRIAISVGPKVSAETALRAIVRALGVSEGNVSSAAAVLAQKGVTTIAGGAGRVYQGSAAQQLTDFCRSAGLEWSIQDGRLLILDRGKALADRAVLLNSDTGLIGSPSVDSKGIASARCLLIPELVPGRLVQFDAVSLKGGYRIVHVEYSGDTYGNDWYADLHAEKY